MSVENFKQQFADLLRPNLYEVLIHPPSQMNAQSNILSFLCSSTDFPFETIQSIEMITHSRKRLIASGVDFDPISMTFLLDSTGKVLDFFQKWKTLIIDDSFKVGYYEEYIGTIEIFMLDRQKRRIFGVKLEEVYPVNRNNIALSYNTIDSLTELTISFVYATASYNVNNVTYPSITNDINIKRTYASSGFQPLSNDFGAEIINDYLGKFGSDIRISNVNNIIQDFTSPFTKKINSFVNGFNRSIDKFTKPFSKYKSFDSSISRLTSPVKKYTSNITKTINSIFKF